MESQPANLESVTLTKMADWEDGESTRDDEAPVAWYFIGEITREGVGDERDGIKGYGPLSGISKRLSTHPKKRKIDVPYIAPYASHSPDPRQV